MAGTAVRSTPLTAMSSSSSPPPGISSSALTSNAYTKDVREGIGATSGGSAQIPFEFTCAAMPDLGLTGTFPCHKVPAGEKFTRINHTTADFIDPPGVAGIGTPSGGRYTARGQLRYSPRPIPTMGDEAAEVTCTLPASDASLCQTIIDGFRPWVDPIGDPDAIQQCWHYYQDRSSADAGYRGLQYDGGRGKPLSGSCIGHPESATRGRARCEAHQYEASVAVRLRRQLQRAWLCGNACVHHRRRRGHAALSRCLQRSDVDAYSARCLASRRIPANRRPVWT